jgi:hypothetical protein
VPSLKALLNRAKSSVWETLLLGAAFEAHVPLNRAELSVWRMLLLGAAFEARLSLVAHPPGTHPNEALKVFPN